MKRTGINDERGALPSNGFTLSGRVFSKCLIPTNMVVDSEDTGGTKINKNYILMDEYNLSEHK